MGELTAIGFNPGRSVFHRLDPRTKQALLIGFSAISVWGNVPFLASLSAAILFGLNAAGVRIGRLMREIRVFLLFLCFLFCVRTFTFDGGWLPAFTMGATGQALIACWRLLLVVCMGLLLMATTRTAHIRAALVWGLKPIPLVDEKMAATMVGLVVRFLPVILFQAAEISDAQRARCIDRCRNPLLRLKRFCIPLFRRVFLRADELVAAMQARCYNENRTLPDLAFTRHDARVALAAGLIALTAFFP